MGETGIAENLARLAIVILMDQDPAPARRQGSPGENAHILIKHQMMDIGAVKQRTDRQNQHDIVRPEPIPATLLLLFDPDAPAV